MGFLLSFIAHSWIEIWYIKDILEQGMNVEWTAVYGKPSCALPVSLQYGLLLGGLVIGYLLGIRWWKLVYVEKKHWRFRKKK